MPSNLGTRAELANVILQFKPDKEADMNKHGPTDSDVDALADAMCQVLNELADGNEVCDLVKARARLAMEPFLLDDNGDLPDIEWARKIASDPLELAIEKPMADEVAEAIDRRWEFT